MRCLCLAAFLVGNAAFAFDGCPDGAERVSTSWPDRPWVCALEQGPRDGEGCPAGSREVSVPSASRPSRCALDGADPEPPKGGCPSGQKAARGNDGRLRCVRGQAAAPAAPAPPRCPKGFDAEFGTQFRKGFRCVAARKAAPKDDDDDDNDAPAKPNVSMRLPDKRPASAACPPGTRRVKTEDPFEPVRCAPGTETHEAALSGAWSRYEVPGELVFEYPESWHMTDGWQDEVPSLFLQPELARDGKPVSLTITRVRPKSASYMEMDAAIRQEVEWHGAKEGGRGSVAGLPARFLEVPRQTRLAYLRATDGYFVLAYSAPEELFTTYAPAYSRLLKSLRVVHDERDPVPETEEKP